MAKDLLSDTILDRLAKIRAAKTFFQKSGSVSHYMSWSAINKKYNIRKI